MAWIFAITLGLSAREFPLWHGVLLAFLGSCLRFWASGYIRKDSRPAVGGPYAWVRNPLYLGTYLMALGAAAAIENWWLLGIGSVLFALVYHFIILDEETKLVRIFGEPYLKYCTLVPRFFPKPWRASRAALSEVNPEMEHHGFSGKLAMKNKAYEALASFAGLVGAITLVAWAWKNLLSI